METGRQWPGHIIKILSVFLRKLFNNAETYSSSHSYKKNVLRSYQNYFSSRASLEDWFSYFIRRKYKVFTKRLLFPSPNFRSTIVGAWTIKGRATRPNQTPKTLFITVFSSCGNSRLLFLTLWTKDDEPQRKRWKKPNHNVWHKNSKSYKKFP